MKGTPTVKHIPTLLYTTGRTTPRQCELAIIPTASLQLKNR